MSLFVSSFYNNVCKRAETVLSPNSISHEQVKDYIDFYLPVEHRMVDGVDSLHIAKVDATLTFNSYAGVSSVGSQAPNGEIRTDVQSGS